MIGKMLMGAKITVKDLKVGQFFTLVDEDGNAQVDESLVWVRGRYDRSSKKYSCYKWADTNHESFFNGSKQVFINFNF